MGEEQEPVGPEGGLHFDAGQSNAAAAGQQRIPTIREETPGDQARNGMIGANDLEYVDGEMVRETLHVEPVMTEVVPGAEAVPHGEMGTIPSERHSTQEDIATHHAEDVAMHDAEVRSQNPPIIVES